MNAKQIQTYKQTGRATAHKNIIIMTRRISINDFRFTFAGYGHYNVTYTSPVTGKQWNTITDNMPLVDATMNADEPKVKDLNALKRICKRD